MAEYANTTSHAQQVGSGAFIPAYGTGEANPDDEHDAALIKDGILAPTSAEDSDAPLTGDRLKARAQALDIEGRSEMTADELRAAIEAEEEN